MGCSMLGLIGWISLLLATNSFSVLAQLITTTLHSTHPQVTYAPESCCMKDIFKRCRKRYDPFTMSTYVDPNSMKRTFFQTSSWGNEPHSSNMKRRVEVSFYGRAVYVYGPPRAQLDNRPGRIEISLNGRVMETVDLESKYREANDEPWNPLLMYHWEGGGGDAAHNLQITLLDAALGTWKWHPIRGFGLESVVYTSLAPWRPPKYSLSASEKLVDLTIHDTNFVTSFTPSHAWKKEESAVVSSQGIRTFHGTSNELAYNSQNIGVTPVAEFAAQCAALAVYGASPAQLAATFAGGFRHGHLQICQGRNCEFIDAHQAYLNVPDHLWNEPVLLYHTDRMQPGSSTAVTMRLLDPPSPVGHLWTMTFSHAVCSQVMPKWPWTHPIPDGNYSNHLVQYHRLDYAPSFFLGLFSPWMDWMGLYSFAAAEPPWFFGLLGNLPGWSTTVQGHEIKIFIPFPTLFPASRYANVRCCIDGWCHYPDIEQWYLKARDSQSNIPLVHYQDLNPFQRHRISMTAVRRKDEVGDRLIAVSQVEYQQVLVAHQPYPTLPIPSMPTQPEPFDDDGTQALGLAAIVITMWCLSLFLTDDQRRGPEREPLLPAPGSRPRLQPQPQLVTTGRSSFPSETGKIREESTVDSLKGPLGVARNPQYGPRFTSSDRDDAKLNFSPETDRMRSNLVVDSSPGLPSDPPGSHIGAAGPSSGWASTDRGSSSGTSRVRHDESPASHITIWIEDATYYHHHRQRPLSSNGTDRGYGAFTPNDYRSWNGHPLPDGAHSRYQQPAYSTNPWPFTSSSQLTSDALNPAIRDLRPASLTSTDSDRPPSYFSRTAPPSYETCVTYGAVMTIPPRPHPSITVPAPPPPRLPEPAARLNPTPGRTDGNSGYQRTGRRVHWDDQQPRPLRQTTEGFAGGGTGRSGHRLQPWSQLAAETASPSSAAAESTRSGGGRERGQERSSDRRRSRRRGEGAGGGAPA